ncbi:two-component regulator propeller domain-containing protein [Maribacter sp.]|uniref:hybrid sensor histidine kinase/response regulator transcription factor n=1 Tax=Maribacter sp. TaxID=1897614 RepID=UPI0025BCA8FF|nr:two-component regulator propeller domain-containing protein [Maribacter sp.]
MNRIIKSYIYQICVGIMLLYNSTTFAQGTDLRFEHFIDDKGLSQNSVMNILQDKEGFLWMATPNGLYKYNGKGFTIYRHEHDNPNSLINNSVYELELDASGNILIGTGRGLSRFNKVTETFSTYPAILKDKRISAIYPEDDGSLWVGTLYSGVYHFDSSDEMGTKPERYSFQLDISSTVKTNKVHSITKDSAGNVWVGTNYSLYKLKKEPNDNYVQFKVLNEGVKSLFLDKNGKLWVGIKGHFLIGIENAENINTPEDLKFKRYSFHPELKDANDYGGLIAISQADGSNLWLGIHGFGLYWFNTETGEFKLYAPNHLNSKSLSSVNVETILVDSFNVLWVGTEEGGLNRCDLGHKDITFLEKNKLTKNSLSNPSVNAIISGEKNAIWVGTENGLNHIKFNGNGYNEPSFSHYYLNNKLTKSGKSFSQPIWSILKDKDNDYWLGSTEGITHMTVDGNEQNVSLKPTEINDVIEVFSSLEDSNGVLWFGSFIDGLIKWEKKKKPNSNEFDFSNAVYYLPNSNDPNSISGKEISCIYEDSKNQLWIGTLQGGLNLVIPGKNGLPDTFVSYQHDPNDINSLSHNSVFSIIEDKNGDYWIGTFGGGLNKMTLSEHADKKPVFKHYREEDGLANNAVYGILESDQGELWISTDKGISSFDPVKETFKNLNKKDGLQSNNFRKNAYFKNKDGYLFFGGLKGLNIFHPDNLKDNTIPAIPKITAFKIKNQAVKVGQEFNERIILNQSISTLENKKIELNYDESVLTFEFAALHYAAPQKNRYSYKLEGFDDEWHNSKNTAFAHYTNLSPGEYTFKVKASNNDGVWSETPATMSFKISPPFWHTIWAYLLYILLLILLLLGVRSYFDLKSKEKTALRIQQEIEKTNKLKLQFFTNISHDFKTPITLIMNPIEEILEDSSINTALRKRLGIIQRNADYLLRLVNQLIEFRKIEVGETRLIATKSNIVNFAREITFSFKALALKKNISLSFESQSYASEVWFDWDKLEKILNNLIANAIKFTNENGSVTVRLRISKDKSKFEIRGGEMESEFVSIEIEDNGPGIPHDQLPHIFERFYQVNKNNEASSKPGSGIGLAITKDLIDLHYGAIEVDSNLGVGTRFILKLPIGNEHLLPEEIAQYSEPPQKTAETNSRLETTIVENVKKKTVSKKKTVLVVDDNQDIRSLVKNGLQKKYNVLEADTGKSALKIVLQALPDLIVSDVLMPEMDGIQLCHELKSNIRTKHIPIILLTALNSVEHRIKGIQSGADAYIPKPFKMKLLSITADKLIESREYMRVLFKTEEQLTPKKIILDSEDKKFLDKIMSLMEEQMSNENYWIEQLVLDMNTSRSTFFRRLKKLTGQPPNDFIRLIRLKRAAQLLEQGELSIAEVSYKVGFNDPNYFGKCFRKAFGKAPSRYVSENEL